MAEGDMNCEFNCPQFYDFCNGVEDDTTGLNCLGGDSPAFESSFNSKSKNLLKNRKCNYKLSTPLNKSPFVNANRQINATDSEKLTERKKRLSKSEGCLNVGASVKNFKKVVYNPVFKCEKSLSESDIRPRKKFPVTPKKVPATPMCLKRRLNNDKIKKLKTTEELELEKIAELQRLTKQHLKLNEKNMKRMKLKPKPFTIPKRVPLKEEKKEKSAAVKEFQKDLELVVKRLNHKKSMRLDVNKPTRKTNRLGAVSSISDLELLDSSHSLCLPPNGLFKEVQMTADEKDILHELNLKEYPGHSGLFLDMNDSKRAALKPFNFHDRAKELRQAFFSKSSIKVNKENEMTQMSLPKTFHISHLGNPNKENNFYVKRAPRTDAGISKRSFKF